MRVLLTNHMLTGYTGSERWVYTMAEEFIKRGDEVTVGAFELGKMVAHLKELGCDVVQLPDYIFVDNHDLVLCNHNTCLMDVRDNSKGKAKVIFTCHGTRPKLEQPIRGADKYIGISDEVCMFLTEKGFKNIKVYNPVKIPLKGRLACVLEKALLINYYNTPKDKMLKQFFREICSELKIKAGIANGDIWGMETAIQEADLVISIGRGVYEALACNKPVIVAGRHGIDGYIRDKRLYEIFLSNNCSGRTCRIPIDKNVLRTFFNMYNTLTTVQFQNKVRKNHDVSNVVDKYLKLYKEVK